MSLALPLALADGVVHVPHSPIAHHSNPRLQAPLCTSRSITGANEGQTPHSPERLVPKDQGTYRITAQSQPITCEFSSSMCADFSSSLSIYGMATSTRGSSTRITIQSAKKTMTPSFTISAYPLLRANESSAQSLPMDQSLYPCSPTKPQTPIDIQPKIVRYSHSSLPSPSPKQRIVRLFARRS
jgi:hypothetical protein